MRRRHRAAGHAHLDHVRAAPAPALSSSPPASSEPYTPSDPTFSFSPRPAAARIRAFTRKIAPNVVGLDSAFLDNTARRLALPRLIIDL